jgi:hypothetical protein
MINFLRAKKNATDAWVYSVQSLSALLDLLIYTSPDQVYIRGKLHLHMCNV